MKKVPVYLTTQSETVKKLKSAAAGLVYESEYTVLAGDILTAAVADKEFMKKVIQEELSKGEEIIFFDIIVKDEKGRVMYAPNLKFTAL